MKIHAHILAHNEEKILPFTLDHYSSICEKIYIYDNMSDDSSDEIYKKYNKVVVFKWDSNNEINELNYLAIKNNTYKEMSRSDVDWVIVCDCDEFLYHHNLIEKLKEYKNNGITVPLISGHQMVSKDFPIYDGKLITDKVKTGSYPYDYLCKNIIFDPQIDAEFSVGAHFFKSNKTIHSSSAELKLLHYKFLGMDYVANIYKKRNERISEFNKQYDWGIHYSAVPKDEIDELLKLNYQVI